MIGPAIEVAIAVYSAASTVYRLYKSLERIGDIGDYRQLDSELRRYEKMIEDMRSKANDLDKDDEIHVAIDQLESTIRKMREWQAQGRPVDWVGDPDWVKQCE